MPNYQLSDEDNYKAGIMFERFKEEILDNYGPRSPVIKVNLIVELLTDVVHDFDRRAEVVTAINNLLCEYADYGCAPLELSVMEIES